MAKTQSSTVARRVEAGMLAAAAIFVALHFVHLQADFPNNSLWNDWAKYTDEGWYGDAAIRHYQLGHWYVPGDFNPAAALPVWPVLELVLFRFTGVGLAAARALTVAVFALTLACCYALLQRWARHGDPGPSLAPATVVLLLAVSPFCFVFARIAIIEPLLVLEMFAALLVATLAGEAIALSEDAAPRRILSAAALWTALLGLMFPLMVLTKTTAVFLSPAILWTLWAATGYRWRAWLRVAVPAAALGVAVWGAYYGWFVRPRYLLDYRYLFAANAYTGFEWGGVGQLLLEAIGDAVWIGQTLFVLSLAAMVGAVAMLFAKGPRANPMLVTMLLWIAGYGAFLMYHANLQPRYYFMLAPPLTALAVLVFEPLLIGAAWSWREQPPPVADRMDVHLVRGAAAITAAALLLAGVNAARQTVGFVLHPEYTWVNAAARLREAVERETAASRAQGGTAHSRLVLSISGSDLSLMTGLPSICDDFGTMALTDRIVAYKPGWYAAWNAVEDDKMQALAPFYRLQRVMSAPAFDDPDRNLLILYRLDPVTPTGPLPSPGERRNTFVRRSLRTKMGEQPTAEQLEH
jgi:hypothetical protein